jgi:hypothetical protein
MKYSPKALAAMYHLYELVGNLRRLSPAEMKSLAGTVDGHSFSPRAIEGLRSLLFPEEMPQRLIMRRRSEASFDEFRFEDVMHRLRNAVMHSSSAADAAELDWLLKIILTSPVVFESVREVDNFLSNMTGTVHTTKSTGRDRVVEWYFKHINSLPEEERNHVYLKIARHLFAQGKSNYREWKEVLYGAGSR